MGNRRDFNICATYFGFLLIYVLAMVKHLRLYCVIAFKLLKLGSTEPYIGITLQNSSFKYVIVLLLLLNKLFINKPLHIKFSMQLLVYQVIHFKVNSV
jgi:hypothetical protein